MSDETAAQLHAMRPNVDPRSLLDELDSWPDADFAAGWAAATAAAAALIRDRSAAYYGRGSEALAAAIEAGEHEPYGGAS